MHERVGEGLARFQRRQLPEVLEHLADQPLVEHVAAGVGAPDDLPGGQPALVFGVAEHRRLAIGGGDDDRHPHPHSVDVAVDRVGLALGRRPALRAAAREEVGALGERVALAGHLQVVREADRQLLARHRHRAAGLAVDERDRGAPGALAGDREVARPVAAGRRAASSWTWSSLQGGRRRLLEALGDRLVGVVAAGDAEHRGRPVAGVHQGRDDDRQQRRGAGDARLRSGLHDRARSVPRSSRRQPASRTCSSSLATSGREVKASTSGWVGETATKAACADRVGVRVKTVSSPPPSTSASTSTPSTRPITARWPPTPPCPAGQVVEAPLVVLYVGADPHEPLRAAHEAHGSVAAPALAVLGLQRGEDRRQESHQVTCASRR